MKKIENTFAVTGFVGKDAEIRQFTTASVARFSLAINRTEKNSEENNRTSAFMNIEAWRKNENLSSFDRLTKGAMITVEGYFKPEEWTSEDGVKHNRVVLVANKFYEPTEKEEAPAPEAKTTKKKGKEAPLLPRKGGFGRSFFCTFSLLNIEHHTLSAFWVFRDCPIS